MRISNSLLALERKKVILMMNMFSKISEKMKIIYKKQQFMERKIFEIFKSFGRFFNAKIMSA
jgi:hypothetical protein